MNGGTSRGGLYGYRLDALLKLATIKSVDQKRNLMNYLADWCGISDFYIGHLKKITLFFSCSQS